MIFWWISKRENNSLEKDIKLSIGRKGQHFFSITKEAAEWCVSFFENNLDKCLRFSLCGDELFIQTAIINNDELKVRLNVGGNMRYIDWTDSKGSPRYLTVRDIERIEKTEKLFARKFSTGIDAEAVSEVCRRVSR